MNSVASYWLVSIASFTAAAMLLVESWAPMGGSGIAIAAGGCLIMDFIGAAWHYLWHGCGTQHHFLHHRKFKAWFLSLREKLMYVAATTVAWLLVDEERNFFVLLSVVLFVLVSNVLGHSRTGVGLWHRKHHTHGDVNFSFTRFPDFLLGTDSSGTPTARRLARQTVSVAVYLGIICGAVAGVSHLIVWGIA